MGSVMVRAMLLIDFIWNVGTERKLFRTERSKPKKIVCLGDDKDSREMKQCKLLDFSDYLLRK